VTIVVERVDFLAVPVMDNATGDAHLRELGLWERNPRSTERWVEYEAPNVTLALVPNAYTGGRAHEPLPFAAFAVRVDDIQAERTRLEGTVEFQGDGFDSTVCYGAPFVGLDGNGMLLHHRYAPHRDGRSPEAPRGRIDFVAVPTRDRDRAEEFYGGMLGLERNPNSSETWVEYETANVTLAPVDPATAGQEFKPLPAGTIAFRVADVEAAAAELESAGVEFPMGVIDSGVCHLAPFSDPDGNGLTLHRRYAPFSDGTTP
jgi:predicted enzyme related to lactoylglutathione lyase